MTVRMVCLLGGGLLVRYLRAMCTSTSTTGIFILEAIGVGLIYALRIVGWHVKLSLLVEQ